MNNDKIVRAWKDSKFRASLSAEERLLLPESPIGELDLSETELGDITGGGIPVTGVSCNTISIAPTIIYCQTQLFPCTATVACFQTKQIC
jgi:mersacidin/lichenicidin family type 2 lantibiotic